MEEKIDKLIQGQVEIQTKLNNIDEKTRDQLKELEPILKEKMNILLEYVTSVD